MRPPRGSRSSGSAGSEARGSSSMSGYHRSSVPAQRQYRGVRMRRWGKWVSEIREPITKKRIWLGSYRTAEEAAHAYDAALLCLRGPAVNLNFPNERPALPPLSPGRSYSTREIQGAAAAAAAASVGRRFSYEEFMSPTQSVDSSDEEEIQDITYNRGHGQSSHGDNWRPINDDPWLVSDMAQGMLIQPPSYSDNDDSDDDDDDGPSLWN